MQNRVFLFAGQGAQKVGMAKELHQENANVRSLFSEAEKLAPGICDLMFSGSQDELNKTINTQPAMYLADLAAAIAESEKGAPIAVCGFSVGEIPALAFSKAFSHMDGFRIILERAKLMQEYSEKSPGGMIAVIGLPCEKVEEICARIPGTYPANYNSDAQTVVAVTSGEAELIAKVAENKGRAIKLAVSGAFHCPALKDAAEKFKEFLAKIEISSPKIPVFANVTAKPYGENVIDLLALQMKSPVRFNETIKAMNAEFAPEFIEVGVGKVLTGLVAKILK